MGLPDGPSGHSQETSGLSMYLRRAEVQSMCRIPTWEWKVFVCQTVPIGCDKYVIRSVSLFVHMVAAAVDALCELEIEFGLPWYNSKNPRVDLQSIWLLALQSEGERNMWQWTGQAIRYAAGMYRDHGQGWGVFRRRWRCSGYFNTWSQCLWRSTGQWGGRLDVLPKSGSSYRASGSDHGKHL